MQFHQGEDHTVKKVGCIFLSSLFFICAASHASSQDNSIPKEFVTSETLTVEDVKATIGECLAAQGCKLQNVIGVHQEGNTARVFVEYQFKTGKKNVIIDLVRFNSGKWYNTSSEDFVMRLIEYI